MFVKFLYLGYSHIPNASPTHVPYPCVYVYAPIHVYTPICTHVLQVTGLKALGVRDMNYRVAFLANSVTYQDGSFYENETKEDIQLQYSEEDREELNAMAHVPNLIARMRKSVAPTVYGHEDIKLGILLMLFGGMCIHRQ